MNILNTLKRKINKLGLFLIPFFAFSFSSCKQIELDIILPGYKGDENIDNSNSLNIAYFKVEDKSFKVVFDYNESALFLLNKLQDEDITFKANDNGNFEKWGELGFNVPSSDSYLNASPLDVYLYKGDSICIFYDKSSYNYTSLGKVEGVNVNELKDILKVNKGEIEITISLNE